MIITKGFRYASREPIYAFTGDRFKPRYHYSEILFDDKRLPQKYVYLDTTCYRNGEPLEVVVYPTARYIKTIKRVKR